MTCLADGCDRDADTRGYCKTHYQTARRHGTITIGPTGTNGQTGPRYAIPGTWTEQAACIGHLNLFTLPDDRGTRTTWRLGKPLTQQINRAKAICRACPSLADCQQWSMSEPDPAVGLVAGGMTPTERRTARREAG